MLRDNQHPAQARSTHDDFPDDAQIEEAVKEVLTVLVLGSPVPPRARRRALDWLEGEIQREDDEPPSNVHPIRPR